MQRKQKSPIDFPKNHNYNKSDYFEILSIDYKTINELNLEIKNLKGYHMKGMTSEYGYLMARKNLIIYKYTLFDVHFHILSEHTLGGVASVIRNAYGTLKRCSILKTKQYN